MKNTAQTLSGIPGIMSLAVGATALSLSSAMAAENVPAPARQRPNIVYILADDLGWTGLSSQGSKYYETPNIDRLATQGMRFTAAYTCPNCAPTRACVFSGKYAPRTGVYTVRDGNRVASSLRKLDAPKNVTKLERNIPTIPEMMRGSGYVTALCGKWHLGNDAKHGPAQRGFDFAVWFHDPAKTLPPIPHPRTDYLTERGIEFIAKAVSEKKPFALFLTHHAVHEPIRAPENLVEKYKAKAPVGGHKNPIYAGMIEELDTSVGRVLAALDKLGVADNTLVIFTSDNGGVTRNVNYVTDNTPLRGGKGMHYEGGIRVPFVARWAGNIKPGVTCDIPIAAIDIAPTVLEIAGVKAPEKEPLDGVSLVPVFKGDRSAAYANRTLFWHCPGYLENTKEPGFRSTPGGVIREGAWKLIEDFEDGSCELYNLEKDISEKTNLINEQPKIAAELKAKLHKWRADWKAPMPTKNPGYGKVSADEKKKKKDKAEGGKKKKEKEDEDD